MSDLADILRQRRFSEPPEIAVIKSYVQEHFQSSVTISMQPDKIIITSSSAALINTLRLHQADLAEACGVTKTIVFRIA
jgi:hypothetical protein